MTYRSLASTIRLVTEAKHKDESPVMNPTVDAKTKKIEPSKSEESDKDVVTPGALTRDTLITKLRAKAENQKKKIDNP